MASHWLPASTLEHSATLTQLLLSYSTSLAYPLKTHPIGVLMGEVDNETHGSMELRIFSTKH